MSRLPEGRDDGFVPVPLAVELAPGTRVGEYTVQRKLGEGGMASVYGAVHPVIGKKAAVKVLAPQFSHDFEQVQRFIQEARAVNAIGHPNIVDVFAFGTLPDGRCYFIMEWLPGETLYQRLWQRRLTLDEALDVLDQVCDALEATHEKGIVHRDLKPANVFLVPTRDHRTGVKLLDFGVAKLQHPLESGYGQKGPRTENGRVVGTPDYLSPEQARGQQVDGRTDLYALGVMAYELVLGRRPFEAESFVDVLRMQLSDPPPAPRSIWPEIPSVLDALLLGLLAKSADKRPTIPEVRAAIRDLRGTPVPVEFADTGAFEVPRSPVQPPTAPWVRTTPAPASLPAQGSQPGAAPSSPFLAPPGEGEGRGGSAPLLPPRSRRGVWLVAGALFVAAAGVAGWIGLHPAEAPPQEQPVHAAALVPPQAPKPQVTPIPPPTLEVEVDAREARIEIDGRLVAESVSSARIPMERAGEHQLTVSAPGRRDYAGRVLVAPSGPTQISVRLERDSSARRRPTTSSRPRGTSGDTDYLVDPYGAKP